MRGCVAKVVQFLRAEDGPTSVEYAFLLAVIITVCYTAISHIGTNANVMFSNVALNTAVSGS